MKAVYTELHRSHDPQFFLVRGVDQAHHRTTRTRRPAARQGLKAGKHDLVAPTVFGQGPRARVHSPNICASWRRPGTPGSRLAMPARR